MTLTYAALAFLAYEVLRPKGTPSADSYGWSVPNSPAGPTDPEARPISSLVQPAVTAGPNADNGGDGYTPVNFGA